MTTQEFSDAFDTLLNSYNNQAIFGEGSSRADITLDEYEKSVFLTQAQDLLIKQYFERTSQNLGFDESERRQIDFSTLITVRTLDMATSQSEKYDDRGILYNVPKDLGILFILNEKFSVTSKNITRTYVVKPISYKEYDREMSKPYAQPLKKQVWRLFQDLNSGDIDIMSEIIPIYGIIPNGADVEYKIRYIKRPSPIILTELPDDLDIDGNRHVTECSLNPIIHMDILNKAVELVLSTRGGRTSQAQHNAATKQQD